MSNEFVKRSITFAPEVRAASDGEELRMAGHAAVFDSYSVDLGFIEIIDRGAFANADMSDVVYVLNHDDSKLLARTTNNSLTLTLDERGLYFDAKMADTSYARDLMVLSRGGFINKASFRFRIERDSWTYDPQRKIDVRRIHEISVVRDVSAVTFPAYEETSIDARSAEGFKKWKQEREADEQLRSVGHLDLILAQHKISQLKSI